MNWHDFDWNGFDDWVTSHLLEEDRLQDLLDELGCNLRGGVGRKLELRGPCPVHGGNNATACAVTIRHNPVRVLWSCFSRHCEKDYKQTITGIVCGVLSFEAGKKVSAVAAVKTLESFIGATWNGSCRKVNYQPPAPRVVSKPSGASRLAVRQNLTLPSPYMLQRGFDHAVLDGLDVGHSPQAGPHGFPGLRRHRSAVSRLC